MKPPPSKPGEHCRTIASRYIVDRRNTTGTTKARSMLRTLLVLSLFPGCVFLLGPRSAGEQGHALITHSDHIGHLDGKLVPVSKKSAFGVSGSALDFRGVAADLLCVSYDTELQWFPGADSKEDVIAKRLKKAQSMKLVFAAPTSVDETDKATFPAAPPEPIEARIIDKGASSEADDRDPTDRNMDTYEIDTTSLLCAPAPKITPAAKFITAVLYPPGDRPELFIWKIDGTPEAFDPAAPPATAPAAGAPDRTGDKAPAVVAPTEDLITVATRDGRFTIFLKLVAASDAAGTLSASTPITAFLPTDDAMKAHHAEVNKWLKNKKQLDRAVGELLCNGNVTPALMKEGAAASDGYMSLQNRLGDYLRVRADGDAFKISKDVHVALPGLPASNGVIYAVDGIVTCDPRGSCP